MLRLACLLVLLAGPAAADLLRIGHLTLTEDPRYLQDWGYARLLVPPPVETEQAAKMALDDLAFVTEAAGIEPQLDLREAADIPGLVAAAQEMAAAGDAAIVLDLPAEAVRAVAEAVQDTAVTLINATAPDEELRNACWENLLHSGPSQRMLMDAFVQYLRKMNWLRVLVLYGETPGDKPLADAFVTSAERLRLDVVDTRRFTLAADPASREGNNVALLTGGADYDLVFIADTRGEFGRYVPYATLLPRPVIGSTGLTGEAWHWAMERDGATQVSSRFDKRTGRKMTSADWSVWIGVKSVVTGYVKTPQPDAAKVRDFLRSPRLQLDGSKGVALNYRAWNGQLRMPVLLATSEAVIAVAPLEGYMHAENTLDTLGTDEAEFACN